VQLTRARSRPEPVPPAGGGGVADEIVVIGAHGGAGVSTLAVLLRPAWDLGIAVRQADDGPRLNTAGRPLVLVTRNTVPAARRATAAVNTITWDEEQVAVLAVVSDGLPEPVAAAYRFQVLAPRVGAIVRVPFIASHRCASRTIRSRPACRARPFGR
jgi:hypothetical protein